MRLSLSNQASTLCMYFGWSRVECSDVIADNVSALAGEINTDVRPNWKERPPQPSLTGKPALTQGRQSSFIVRWWGPQSVSPGVPRCLTPIPYRIHQDRFVPARRALEGTPFEARSLRRDACNPHVFAAYRTRTACDWRLGLNGGLRCVHGYYLIGCPSEDCAALGRKICSILRIRTDSLMEIGRSQGS
jgi:hypothetical protein